MGEIDGELHKRIDESLRVWRQGDCVIGEHLFLFRTSLDGPLTQEARDAAAEGVDSVEAEVRGFMIASQTCDIVRECADRPFVEVCPLVDVDAEVLEAVRLARKPKYGFVPGVADSNLVADLDRTMTVEKSVLVGWRRITGCRSDGEVRLLGQALGRKRQRFAFPNDFDKFVKPLSQRLKDKHKSQSDEGRALRSLREIRVRAAPSWDEASIELMFWFLRDDGYVTFEKQSWNELREKWLALVRPKGRFRHVDGIVATLDDITARDHVESDVLDLDHLSIVAA